MFNELDLDEKTTCRKCGAEISVLAVFPGGICLECHGAKYAGRLPEPPDFTKVINKKAVRNA